MREESSETKGRFQSVLFEWGEALVIAISVVVLLFSFVVRLNGVRGESMLDTLQDRDMMLVLNRPLCGEIKKSDIVMLQKNGFYSGEPIVKRIIATAGDKIDIDWENGDVLVNGQALEEPYIRERIAERRAQDTTELPQTVPAGCVFVMGDNRNHSTDSRNDGLGMVDERYIIGRVLARVWPVKGIGAIS